MTALRAAAPAPAGVPPPDRRPAARHAATWAIPAVVMLAVGAAGLRRGDAMGNDESVTRWASGLRWGQLWHLLTRVDAVHGLYYALIKVYAHVAGHSPFALRIPSVLAMAAGVAVVADLARRLAGSPWAGLAAGVVAALTPSVSYYAQTARSYALVYAGVAATTWLFVRALRTRQVRLWVAYAVLAAVSGWLNEMALLAVVAHAATLLWARCGRREVLRWTVAAAVAVLAVAPLIHESMQQDRVLDGLARPGWPDVRTLTHDYLGRGAVAPVVVGALAVVALWSSRHRRIGAASVGLPLLVLPAAVLMIYSSFAKPVYFDRYVLYGELGAALLAGTGAAALARRLTRRPVVTAAAVLVPCLVAGAVQLPDQRAIRTPASRQFDFGGPAHWIGARARDGDAVLFFNDFFRKVRLGYPAEFARVRDIGLATPPAVTGDFRGRDRPFPAVRTAMLGQQRIWVVGVSPDDRPALGPWIALQAGVLHARFREAQHHRWGRTTVSLWVRD